MTVQELIDILNEYPGDANVYIDVIGPSGEYAGPINTVTHYLDSNTVWIDNY